MEDPEFTGGVAGIVATSTNPSLGIANAYVAIINASNISQAYYVGQSDENGYFQFTEVNSTYNGAEYEDLYRLYANHSLFGEGYSGVFHVREYATTGMNVYIDALPVHVALTASRDCVTANSGDYVTITAYVTDAMGIPVMDDTRVCFAIDATDWTAASNGSLGHDDTNDYLQRIDNVGTIGGYASVSFGWVDPEYAGNSSRIKASYASDDSVNAWTDIAFDAPAPVASFTGAPTSGEVPLAVAFDSSGSAGEIETYEWSWGDDTVNGTSATPVHEYTTAGTFTVILTVSGPGGSDAMQRADYITVSPTPTPTPAPVAYFTGTPVSGEVPLTVTFDSSGSTGDIDTYAWSWGDDSANGTTATPVHEYTDVGTYTVILTTTGPGGSDAMQRTDYITVNPTPTPAPVASFTASPTSGEVPLTVSFDGSGSTGEITSYAWSWGDNTANGTDSTPVHEYSDAGTYTVILTVTGPGGSDAMQQTGYITVNPTPTPAPVARFTGLPTEGTCPLTVTFDSSSSTGIIYGYEWSWGDLTDNNTEASPTHVYTTAGKYTIILTVSGPGGSSSMESVDYVTVANPTPSPTPTPAPVARFTGSPVSGMCPLTVDFDSDTSEGIIDDYQWSWGDETENGTTANPSHTYEVAGIYTVILTVSGPGGSSSLEIADYIAVANPTPSPTPTPAPVAGFTGAPTSGTRPVSVTFDSGSSTGLIDGYEWSWGDSTDNDTTASPTHVYYSAGTYTVILTVTGPGGSSSIERINYITVTDPTPTPTPAPVAGFTGSPASGTAPLSVTFDSSTSEGIILDYQWSWGDSTDNGTIASPSHVYTSAGTYTVILTVTGPGGSSSTEQIGYITVTDPIPTPTPCPGAGFSGFPTGGVSPLTVDFDSGSSTGIITDYQWSWGDSTNNGTVANPSHTYTLAGTYTVILTVIGPGGSASTERIDYITVTDPTPTPTPRPVAGFTGFPTGGVRPLTVNFDSSSSTGIISDYQWSWGDNTANGTTASPSHVYSSAGTYTVVLTVSGPGGSSALQQADIIIVTNPTPTPTPLPASIEISADRYEVTTNGSDTITLSAYMTDDLGNPVVDDYPIVFAINEGDTYAPEDYGCFDVPGQTRVIETVNGYANVTFGWVPESTGKTDVTITAAYEDDVTVSDSTLIGFLKPENNTVMFDITLAAGWSLVSVPVVLEDNNISRLFPADVLSNIVVVWAWDSTEQAYDFYTPLEGYTSTLSTIDEKSGFWVYSNVDQSFTVIGELPTDTTMTMKTGWNLVGNPVMSDRNPGDVYSDYVVVWGWDCTEQAYDFYTPLEGYTSTLTSLSPGNGYWVYKG